MNTFKIRCACGWVGYPADMPIVCQLANGTTRKCPQCTRHISPSALRGWRRAHELMLPKCPCGNTLSQLVPQRNPKYCLYCQPKEPDMSTRYGEMYLRATAAENNALNLAKEVEILTRQLQAQLAETGLVQQKLDESRRGADMYCEAHAVVSAKVLTLEKELLGARSFAESWRESYLQQRRSVERLETELKDAQKLENSALQSVNLLQDELRTARDETNVLRMTAAAPRTFANTQVTIMADGFPIITRTAAEWLKLDALHKDDALTISRLTRERASLNDANKTLGNELATEVAERQDIRWMLDLCCQEKISLRDALKRTQQQLAQTQYAYGPAIHPQAAQSGCQNAAGQGARVDPEVAHMNAQNAAGGLQGVSGVIDGIPRTAPVCTALSLHKYHCRLAEGHHGMHLY